MMDYVIIIDKTFKQEKTDRHVFKSELNFKVRKIFRDLKKLIYDNLKQIRMVNFAQYYQLLNSDWYRSIVDFATSGS